MRKFYISTVMTGVILLSSQISHAQEAVGQSASTGTIEATEQKVVSKSSAKTNDNLLEISQVRGKYSYDGIVISLKANLEGQECTGAFADQKFVLDNCDTVSAGEMMRILNASYLLKKKVRIILLGDGADRKKIYSAEYID